MSTKFLLIISLISFYNKKLVKRTRKGLTPKNDSHSTVEDYKHAGFLTPYFPLISFYCAILYKMGMHMQKTCEKKKGKRKS